MRFLLTLILLGLLSIHAFCQYDSIITLRIIDQKICYNKKTSALNFSYYFENHSDSHLVIIDYYEPCVWENPLNRLDSNQTFGLVLKIVDDSGKVLLPTVVIDSVAMSHHEKYTSDSTRFFEVYERTRDKDYLFHTRSLRPLDVLINLYNLKMNKRKCFYKSTFAFDYTRKYKIHLYYQSNEDVAKLVRHSVLNKDDVLFIGTLKSNEVDLCFK